MPRVARNCPGGICYHVLNRGNGRARVFRHGEDYREFLKSMERACLAVPMRVLAFCLMPNHFHLVVWPLRDGELSRWMHLLLNSHVQKHRKRYATVGHVWQGRFKAFAVRDDTHLLTVLRYVERNPVRGGLVLRSQEWPWSTARLWSETNRPTFLCEGPVPRPAAWCSWIDQDESATALTTLRRSAQRGTPFGDPAWVRAIAQRLDVESSLRARGRPARPAIQRTAPSSPAPVGD